MSIHEQIVENFNAYIAEHEKWEDKGVKACLLYTSDAADE